MAVGYVKTVWRDRNVQYPNRFTMVTNGDGTVNLTPSPGTIIEAGTPLSSTNMSTLESGIDDLEKMMWMGGF